MVALPFPSTVPSPGTLEELLLTFTAHWNVMGNSPLSQAESVRLREAELLTVTRWINSNSGTQAGYLGPEAGLVSVSRLLHLAFLGPKSHSQTQFWSLSVWFNWKICENNGRPATFPPFPDDFLTFSFPSPWRVGLVPAAALSYHVTPAVRRAPWGSLTDQGLTIWGRGGLCHHPVQWGLMDRSWSWLWC